MTTVQSETTTSAAASDQVQAPRRSFRPGPALLTTVTWIIAILFFFPVLWMVLTAFKTESAAQSDPPTFLFTPTTEQFATVFDAGLGPYFANSLGATLISTVLVLLLATPAAFSLSLRPVEKTQDVLFFFISTKMLPVVAAIVPIYVVVNDVGLLDNIWTLVVLYTAMNLPIAVWMMRSFFLEVPTDLLEAASIDGASLWRTLREVVLPIISPGIFATGLPGFRSS